MPDTSIEPETTASSLQTSRMSPRSVVDRERRTLAEIAAGRPIAQVLEGLLLAVEERATHTM